MWQVFVVCGKIVEDDEEYHFKDDDLQAMVRVIRIPGNTRLDLAGNQLGSDLMDVLASELGKNPQLTYLNVVRCRSDSVDKDVNISSWRRFGAALARNTNLKRLSITENGHLRGEATGLLMAGLKENKTLKILCLDGSPIGPTGAAAIAGVLSGGSLLDDLSICGTGIGDVGAKHIAAGLKTNTALKRLNMNSNEIGEAGAMAVAEVILVNAVLNYLSMMDNPIGREAVRAMVRAAAANRVLKTLFCRPTPQQFDEMGIMCGLYDFKNVWAVCYSDDPDLNDTAFNPLRDGIVGVEKCTGKTVLGHLPAFLDPDPRSYIHSCRFHRVAFESVATMQQAIEVLGDMEDIRSVSFTDITVMV